MYLSKQYSDMLHKAPKLVHIWLCMITKGKSEIRNHKNSKYCITLLQEGILQRHFSLKVQIEISYFHLGIFFRSPIQFLLTLVAFLCLLLWDLDNHFAVNPYEHIQHTSYISQVSPLALRNATVIQILGLTRGSQKSW